MGVLYCFVFSCIAAVAVRCRLSIALDSGRCGSSLDLAKWTARYVVHRCCGVVMCTHEDALAMVNELQGGLPCTTPQLMGAEVGAGEGSRLGKGIRDGWGW